MNIDIKTEQTFILTDEQVEIVRRVLDLIIEEGYPVGLSLEDMVEWPITGTAWEGPYLKRIVLIDRYEFSFHGKDRLSDRYGYVKSKGVCVEQEPESTGNHRSNWKHRHFRVGGLDPQNGDERWVAVEM